MRFKITYLFVLLCISVYSFAQKSPAGYVVVGSNCASGGYDYYFFPNKEVVAVWGLGESPNPIDGGIYRGTWELNAKGEAVLSYQYAVNFVPAKNAKVLMVAAQTIYDLYEAKIDQNPTSSLMKTITLNENDEGCESTKKHNYTNTNDFFRLCLSSPTFKRQYNFTSSKILSEQDLARYSKTDLEIMRNELFAQYGFAFQNPKWKEYFGKRGASNSIVNADILLTETEKANLEIIKAAEAKKKK